MKPTIPVALLEAKSNLHVPDEHQIFYKPLIWRKWLEDKDLNGLIEKYSQSISRAEIARMVSRIAVGGESPRKVFLATMLWGYGTVGYGAYRTAHMLRGENSQNVIDTAYHLVRNGDYIDAYKRFSLPRCGPAFFTKYFYFGTGKQLATLAFDP